MIILEKPLSLSIVLMPTIQKVLSLYYRYECIKKDMSKKYKVICWVVETKTTSSGAAVVEQKEKEWILSGILSERAERIFSFLHTSHTENNFRIGKLQCQSEFARSQNTFARRVDQKVFEFRNIRRNRNIKFIYFHCLVDKLT